MSSFALPGFSPASSMKRIIEGFNLELAGTKDFWRPDFFVLMAIVNVLFTLVLDGGPSATKFGSVILTRLLVTCANICIAWLLSTWFYDKRRTLRAGFIFNLTVVEFMVFFGNIAMIFMLQALGISNSVHPGNRLVGAALVGPVLFFASVYILDASYTKTKLRIRVLNLLQQVRYLELHTDDVVSKERIRLANQVRTALAPKIMYAKNLVGGLHSAEAINVLRFLNQSDVRPLANEISWQLDSQPETASLEKPRLIFSVQSFNLEATLRPSVFLILEVITYVSLAGMARQFPDFHVLASLVAGFVFLVALKLALRFAPARLSKLRFVPIVGLLVLVLALTLGLSLWIDKIFHSEEAMFSLASLVGTVTNSFSISAAMAMTGQQAKRLLGQLEDLEQNLKLHVSRLRQKQWVSRQEVVSQVHGQVQGAIVAALTRLGHTDDPSQVEKAKADLDRALNSLNEHTSQTANIRESLDDLASAWEGVCQIELQLDAEAEANCNRSATTAFVVGALVTEGIVNAVRHGDAKTVQVSLQTLSPGLLSLRLTDDGQLEPASVPGNGSRLMTDLSTAWSLKRIDSKTVLEIVIPLAYSSESVS